MDSRVAPLAALAELNTDLLMNCLEGLTDLEAQRCLSGGGNSVAFLAAHLVDTRHFLVSRLGHALENPMAPFLADVRGIEDIRQWPAVEDIRAAGMIAFLAQHDSYHVGQLAFLRRQLGKPAMAYTRSTKPD